MDKLFFIAGIGIIGSVYLHYDKIKANYLKYEAISKANKLVLDFFKDELKKDPYLTLEDAILKFEDPDLDYKTLEEMSEKKGRPIICYINAYEHIFNKAKKNLNF